MRKLIYIIVLCFVSNVSLAQQTETKNYVKNTSYLVKTTDGSTNAETSAELNLNDKIESITYFDGLGRPTQTISQSVGGNGQDIVTPIYYDEFGRQLKEYLPFARTPNFLYYDDNLNKDPNGEILALNGLYASKHPEEWGLGNTPNPYSQKVVEASPLDRILEQAAPGNDWAVGNGHTIKFGYETNNLDEVKYFKVHHPDNNTEKTELIYDGYYEPNKLYKTITKDENWIAGNDHTTEEFKNRQGQVVLKRTYAFNEPHDTYYVYDNFGNLTYVLPPEASQNIITFGNQGFLVASQVNYHWSNMVSVDKKLADEFNKKLVDYDNETILNADIENEFGGQGGFTVTTFADSDLVTLSINFSATKALKLKQGMLLSLKNYGNFKDTELGNVKGPKYNYYFVIRNNSIHIEGSGDLTSINASFSSSQKLSYSVDYTWQILTDVDSKFAQTFDKNIKEYARINGVNPLNVYLNNDYGAQGGLAVTVDDNDNISLNFNMSSTTPLAFKKNFAINLGLKRRLEDRELGTIIGQGFSYNFYLRDNTLYANGSGMFTAFNGFMFSPTTPNNPTIEIAAVEGLCYIYHYDYRNRLVEKKIPGKGWEHIVYDKLDRPILTQDAKQRQDHLWLFTKYDALGRVTYTGNYEHLATNTLDNSARLEVQNIINTQTNPIWFETKLSQNSNLNIRYSNDAFPNNATNIEVFTVNYYDDHNFNIPAELGSFQNTYNQQVVTQTKTLATGSQVRVLGTDHWITSVSYYDYLARPIFMTSHNTYLNTVDKLSTHLDFTGKVLETTSMHIKDGNTPITLVDNFTYDYTGRLLTQKQTINGSAAELLVNNHYDAFGQLVQKNIGGNVASTPTQSLGLQMVDYKYNIRGWLKSINNGETQNGDLFGFKLNYNDIADTNLALYNGNISEILWQTANDNAQRGYVYNYDALNRIKKATYNYDATMTNTTDFIEDYSLIGPNNTDGIAYDKNGNITSLRRMGLREALNNIDVIDDLNYVYAPLSNKLLGVSDDASTDGFNNGNITEIDYLYDINGNMTQDLNKGIKLITYNHLNLPTEISFTEGGSGTLGENKITYIYDATGVKLEKQVSEWTGVNLDFNSTKSTAYAGNYIYEKSSGYDYSEDLPLGFSLDYSLKFFSHAEGYIEPRGSGNYDYVYQYKDHLGNIRLSYADSDGNGSIDPSTEIIEEKNYYPFGLEHKGYNNVVNGTEHPYKYNGMEHQEELGLNMYDYGARNYDPAIGRWWQIDPLAEQMRRFSPYNFAWNNPVYFIDPDGMFAQPFTELFDTKGKKIGEDANGDDGNVSIVSKDVAKSVKKGKVSVDDAIAGGVQTTKTVLTEALDVLQRTEDNGGLSEEASTVTADGTVARSETGSAEPEMRNGVAILKAEVTVPRGDGNTSIHSHITEGVTMNDDGTASGTTSSALEPGPDDPSTFSSFSQNIIVGRLGKITTTAKTMTKPSTISKPSLGVAIFGNNITTQSKPQVKLTKRAVQKIIE